MNNNLKIREGVVLLEIKDTFLLVSDREARKYCRYVLELNDVGALIWQCLEQGMTEEAMLDKIGDAYDITDRDVVKADIRTFIRQLADGGYLTAEGNDGI